MITFSNARKWAWWEIALDVYHDKGEHLPSVIYAFSFVAFNLMLESNHLVWNSKIYTLPINYKVCELIVAARP